MKNQILPALDSSQRYSINEASALLRQCRAKTYKDIATDRLEVFKDGRRTYVTGRSILARSTPTPMTPQTAHNILEQKENPPD
jgi:hypothetical protein